MTDSPFSGRHARPELGTRDSLRHPRDRSIHQVFLPADFIATACQSTVLARGLRLDTAFCSPSTSRLLRNVPRRGHHSRPTPSAEAHCTWAVRSAATSHPRVLTPGMVNDCHPFPSCRNPPLLSSKTVAPLQGSLPSASQRPALSGTSNLPWRWARSPLAPRSFLISLASDHRSRSAAYHSACCPMNLLEPTPVSLQTPLASIEIEL
jgi:hypothetical protein